MKSYIYMIMFVFFLFSCNKKKEIDLKAFSINNVGKIQYEYIRKSINDSINLWIDSNLGLYHYFKINQKYQLDEIICFNNSKNKFVSAILLPYLSKTANDNIWFFYGAKIENKWYFFQGATIVLPREMYQKDVTKPLSFEKLHEIALKEVFSGYLKKKEPIVPFWKFWVKQEYEIDESYFDNHFRGQGWGGGDWIEDSDGSNGHWNGRIYTDEEFNKMYKEKALSVWPSSNPLTSFYDVETKRWRNIHQDSFDILLKAKKINPNGTPVE